MADVSNLFKPKPARKITYPFPIRDDFICDLRLPQDMTVPEAERLCKYIMTLGRGHINRG